MKEFKKIGIWKLCDVWTYH